ncbi:MAG: hypothetical protein U0U67_00130 [Chitinophagales bacterium]
MRTIFILLFVFSTIVTLAKNKGSKVDLNNDTVTVDNKPVFVLEKHKEGTMSDYYVVDLNGNKLMFLKANFYVKEFKLNPTNTRPPSLPTYKTVAYFEITFLESKQKTEIRHYIQSSLAKFLVKSGLIADGKIVKDIEEEFILENGNRFSEERKYYQQ